MKPKKALQDMLIDREIFVSRVTVIVSHVRLLWPELICIRSPGRNHGPGSFVVNDVDLGAVILDNEATSRLTALWPRPIKVPSRSSTGR